MATAATTTTLEVPGSEPNADDLALKLEKRRAKVRSAWISFVGRIIAQIMGAVATITLGLILVQKYHAPVTAMPAAAPEAVTAPPVIPVRAVTPGHPSLVVLPLEDIGRGDATFAIGMTDALITEFAQLDDIRVISRTSSATYAKAQRSLPAIARELSVDFAIDGSVMLSDGRVRVALRLVDTRSDECVFAESYERPLRQILGVQSEVARTVARKMTMALMATSQRTSKVASRGRAD
jgi:TolB-like protein